MKKIISILILVILIGTLLCGCGNTTTKFDGNKPALSDKFAVIRLDSEGFFGDKIEYVYDKETKVVYMYLWGGYHAALSPYYVVVNGEPTVAIYGVNYGG